MHAECGRGLKGHGRRRRAHILMSSLLKGAKVLNSREGMLRLERASEMFGK